MPGHYYLIADTNIFLQCMDTIEHQSAFYIIIIILQTIPNEVCNQSVPLDNCLIGIIYSDQKYFYIFHNKFRVEMHMFQEKG